MTELKPLHKLKPGQEGRIEYIKQNFPAADRLQELMFIPGAQVKLCRQAPFGGPVVIRVAETQIGIRPDDAAQILVSITL